MNKLFLITIFFGCLVSCSDSESYMQIDVRQFNNEISGKTDIETPNDLIKLFFKNYRGGNEEATPISIPRDNGSFEIFLIENVKNDGAKKEEQIKMKATRQGKTWHVTEIKENWKCAGSDKFGTEPCK